MGRTSSAPESGNICSNFDASQYPGGSGNTVVLAGLTTDSNVLTPAACCTPGIGSW